MRKYCEITYIRMKVLYEFFEHLLVRPLLIQNCTVQSLQPSYSTGWGPVILKSGRIHPAAMSMLSSPTILARCRVCLIFGYPGDKIGETSNKGWKKTGKRVSLTWILLTTTAMSHVSCVFWRFMAFFLKLPFVISLFKIAYDIKYHYTQVFQVFKTIQPAIEYMQNLFPSEGSVEWLSLLYAFTIVSCLVVMLVTLALSAQVITCFNMFFFRKTGLQAKLDLANCGWIILFVPIIYKVEEYHLFEDFLQVNTVSFGVKSTAYAVGVLIDYVRKELILLLIGILIDFFLILIPFSHYKIYENTEETIELLILP